MTASLWDDCDFPVLQAVQWLTVNGPPTRLDAVVAEVAALPQDVVSASLLRLREAHFISGDHPMRADDDGAPIDWFDLRLAERGLRAVGEWPPSDQYAAIVEALDQFVERQVEPDDRSRAERIRAAVLDGGKDLAINLGATVFTKWSGLA